MVLRVASCSSRCTHLDRAHAERVGICVHAAVLAHDHVAPQVTALNGCLEPTVHRQHAWVVCAAAATGKNGAKNGKHIQGELCAALKGLNRAMRVYHHQSLHHTSQQLAVNFTRVHAHLR
jgi:hypothetical protein